MNDLTFNFGSFAATSVTVAAVTANGRDFLSAIFGAGAVSVVLPKSKAEDFAQFAAQKGLTL
jgi:hypothetical protein